MRGMILLGVIMSWVAVSFVWAQDVDESVYDSAEVLQDGADETGDVEEPQAPVKKKARIVREKETDGTQAANRFKGDPVIKSRYQLNGQPLEVDPD